MYFKIDLEDGISPVVQRWLKNNPRFISSVLKSTGYMVQNELKEAVRGKFTGQSWPQRWTLPRQAKIIEDCAWRMVWTFEKCFRLCL